MLLDLFLARVPPPKRPRHPPWEDALSRMVDAMLVQNLHVTFVIGAGVSRPAGVLTGLELANALQGEFSGTLASMQSSSLRQPFTLDQILTALAKHFDDIRFRDVVAPRFPTRTSADHSPTFTHEILAHWLYHGGATWVVDFNFDELLYAAADDEFGINAYGFLEAPLEFNDALARYRAAGLNAVFPHRILKPHGTIRLPDSLRAREDDITRFPDHVHEVLRTVMAQSTFVVLMGYSCRDPDFLSLVKGMVQRSELPPLLVVDPTVTPVNALREAGVSHDRIFHAPLTSDAFVSRTISTLKTRDPLAPRLAGVQRHEIRDILFHQLRVPPTLPNRLRLAYIMHAVKQRGYFHSAALRSCRRIPNYERALADLGRRIFDDFQAGDRPIFVSDGDWYILNDLPELGGIERNAKFIRVLETALESAAGIVAGDVHARTRLLDLFTEMRCSFDIEPEVAVQPLPHPLHNPVQLHDLASIIRTTRDVVDGTDKQIDIVSESGEWLLRPEYITIIRDRGITVRLLLVGRLPARARRYQELLRDTYAKLTKQLRGRIKVRASRDDPGWRFSINDKKVEGLALAFRRTERQSRSTFWKVVGERDLTMLHGWFDTYWKAASRIRAFDDVKKRLATLTNS